MNKEILVMILIISFAFEIAKCQENLINDYSFEEKVECPVSINTNRLKILRYWSQPTLGTTDYFHKCTKGAVGVPKNHNGFQEPSTGDAYVGMILSNGSGNNSREYIQTRLKQQLEKDSIYYIELKLSLCETNKYAVSSIGCAFFGRKKNSLSKKVLKQMSGINFSIKHIKENYDTWIVLSGYYKANGNEKYLVIGNFEKDSPQTVMRIEPHKDYIYKAEHLAYYWIDDVILMKGSDVDKLMSIRINNYGKIKNITNEDTTAWDTLSNYKILSCSDSIAYFKKEGILDSILNTMPLKNLDTIIVITETFGRNNTFGNRMYALSQSKNIALQMRMVEQNLYIEPYGLEMKKDRVSTIIDDLGKKKTQSRIKVLIKRHQD